MSVISKGEGPPSVVVATEGRAFAESIHLSAIGAATTAPLAPVAHIIVQSEWSNKRPVNIAIRIAKRLETGGQNGRFRMARGFV